MSSYFLQVFNIFNSILHVHKISCARKCLIGTIEHADNVEVFCPYRDNTYSCNMKLQQREIKAVIFIIILNVFFSEHVLFFSFWALINFNGLKKDHWLLQPLRYKTNIIAKHQIVQAYILWTTTNKILPLYAAFAQE